jgi:hypothetical protein
MTDTFSAIYCAQIRFSSEWASMAEPGALDG